MAFLSFDIFCRVIDNYGDIGVCWRLARQLAATGGVGKTRLWVDDTHSFSRIEPRLAPALPTQEIQGIEIVRWVDGMALPRPHDVVVEAFACDPPPGFIQQMQPGHLWINLEYLSAEPWVERFHAQPSPQPGGQRKAFFFPGFTPGTGGLLREPGLLATRDRWLADRQCRARLLTQLGLENADIQALCAGQASQIMLFSYPDAPAQALVAALGARPEPAVVLVPAGVCPALHRGQHGRVLVQEIPFVDQDGFDRLLWSSDLNCVRGEESLVRAMWAARPLLWHIYAQQEQAHLDKLRAWLDLSPFEACVKQAMHSWNTADARGLTESLRAALRPPQLLAWQQAADQWARRLASQDDLASALLRFCQAGLA